MMKWQKIRPWILWLLGAGFFFCEYFARVDPSVMIEKLMLTFHADYSCIGSLSAYFYYPYILMQLPVGLLLDRYGTRRWLALAAIVSAVGAFGFGAASQLWMVKVGRMLIGFGASFAFVGAMKIATMWFSRDRLGLMAGLTQGSGMLGAAFGEGVFIFIVAGIGWRNALFLIAGILLLFGILIFALVRDQNRGNVETRSQERIPIPHALKIILSSKQSWLVAIYAGLLYSPTAALAELWGVNFFHHLHHLSLSLAALMMSLIFIGWAIGGPIMGWLSDKFNIVRRAMLLSALASLLIMSVVIYAPGLSPAMLIPLLFCYGLVNTGVAVAYAVASRLHQRQVVGVSVAFTNMASIMIGALLQPVLGWLLDVQWSGQYSQGLQYFPPIAYQRTLVVLPICLVLSVVCVYFMKPFSYSEK